jgi:hypothetical protein
MPLTRAQGEAALNYVVLTVLNQPDDGPLMKSLRNDSINDVSDFPSLQEIDIENLKYPEDDGSLSALVPGLKGRLRAFCAFIRYRVDMSLPIGDNWTSITPEEYDEFRCSRAFDGTIYGVTSSANPGLPTAQSTRARDPVTDFKRGIKRDPSLYPVLKDIKQWDDWQRTTIAQSQAQDVAEVLDPTYIPVTPEEKALFKEKQKYWFAVFVRTLQTDQGKAYVREFENELDAQSIYRCICEYALKSTKAAISASDILTYITSCKLGEGSPWRGSTESFVLHWQNQVRLYEAQVAKDEHFSPGQKKNMLQNAVRPVPVLSAVKETADHLKTQDGKEQTYDSYCKLLLSAASTYDSQFAPKTFSGSRPPRRAVDLTYSRLMHTRVPLLVHLVLLVHLAPACHFSSGTSYLRMLRISGITCQMKQRASSSTLNGIPHVVLHALLFEKPTFMTLVHTTTFWPTSMIFATEAKAMSTTLRIRGL